MRGNTTTITLDIAPEIEQQIREEAERRGLDMGTFAQQVFREALKKSDDRGETYND